MSGSRDILYSMPGDTDAISSRTDGCQEVSDVLEENNSDNSDNSDDSDEEEPEEELEGIALVEPEPEPEPEPALEATREGLQEPGRVKTNEDKKAREKREKLVVDLENRNSQASQ